MRIKFKNHQHNRVYQRKRFKSIEKDFLKIRLKIDGKDGQFDLCKVMAD